MGENDLYIKLYLDWLQLNKRGLNYNEIILLSEIYCLFQRQGCFSSDTHLSELLCTSPRNIQLWLKKLETNGYITRYYDGNRRKIDVHIDYISQQIASVQ